MSRQLLAKWEGDKADDWTKVGVHDFGGTKQIYELLASGGDIATVTLTFSDDGLRGNLVYRLESDDEPG